jgi:tryptophan synthase beta chain
MENFRICLSETELPQEWYNIQPDLPRPFPPYLHPATGQPLGPQDLAPIFPMGLIEQEMSREPLIPIPDEVLRVYRLWRPTPSTGPGGWRRP